MGFIIMGLKDGKCDSCGEEPLFLFPIAVTVELPTGGTEFIVRYYCVDCKNTMEETAGEQKEEEEKNFDEKEVCACCNNKIEIENGYDIDSYFCYGCGKYICMACCSALEKGGKHTLKDHKEACSKAGNHPYGEE